MATMDDSTTSPLITSDDTTLVLGASGKTGRRVLARLRLRGVPVRAASRSSATRFDWADPRSWARALEGVRAVYMIPPRTPGLAQEFVSRAEAAGVQHLVLLSGRGIEAKGPGAFGADMRAAEDAVRASAMGWTILRSSNFAQNFDEDVFHAPLVAGELVLPVGPVPEPFIDIEDVADVAAAVLADPKRHTGRVYELSGPRAITFAEAVELISRASGRPIAFRQVTSSEYVSGLVEQGLSFEDAEEVAQMFVLMSHGPLSTTSADVPSLLGRAARSFEDYVTRAAAAGAWCRP
jgi:uncharacterized protein YbjT (DUF2867 family)